MNIVLFGDSHLGRFGEKLIGQLESLVEGATAYNCSAGGFTSSDGVKRVDFIAKLKPELVIFTFGGNDVTPWKQIVSKDIYLRNMRKIFEAFPESAKLMLLSPDVAVADPEQTREYNSLLHEYQTDLRPICQELGVDVVEASQVLASLNGDIHVEDGVHMNDQAYAKVIEALAQAINSHLLQ